MIANPIRFVFTALIIVVAGAQMEALGDTAAPPTTAPSRHVVVIPPGFHVVTLAGENVICQPADDAWVKAAVLAVKPSTQPTTMPSDLIQSIKDHRTILASQMMSDFALTDPKPLNDMIDGIMLDALQKLEKMNPPLFYLVISKKQLAEIMDNGWEDPHFHYIRFANDVEYANSLNFSLDAPMDDQVIWVPVQDDDAVATKSDTLTTTISELNIKYASALSSLAQQGTLNSFSRFILTQVMDPLKLPASEQWFPQAIAEVYAIKYATFLTGGSRQGLINALLAPNPQNPIQPLSLNLVNPLDPSSMTAQGLPFYNDAVVRKGAFIVVQWVNLGGEGVVAKTLPELRAFPPSNPEDLIKAVKDATGIDLTPAMLPSSPQ
ncbi:MAG: hypothetical protein ABSG31_11440 [Tepidisphaeraceae bacterium]